MRTTSRFGGSASSSRSFRGLLRRHFRVGDVHASRASPFVNSVPIRLALCGSQVLELFVYLELPLVNVVQEFLNLQFHRMPRMDCRSLGFSDIHAVDSPTRIVAVSWRRSSRCTTCLRSRG